MLRGHAADDEVMKMADGIGRHLRKIYGRDIDGLSVRIKFRSKSSGEIKQLTLSVRGIGRKVVSR